MLRIRALHLEDFGPFKGPQVLIFPEDDGVAVVYGENMRGKTSLLNAIRFAFFGKVLGRGSKATSLHQIGNWERAAEGQYGFRVELEFTSDGVAYKLTRSCTPRVDVPEGDQDYSVEHFLQREGDVLGPDQAAAELKRILPEQISRFFLFDGELLQEYEDLLSSESDMGRRISEAIERILGVPVLTSARSTALRLKEKSEKSEAKAAQGDQKTREFGNQLSELQHQRDILKGDHKKLTADLAELFFRKAGIEESLKRKERYSTLLERRDGLERHLKDLQRKQADRRSELQSAMSSAWCALLAPEARLRSEALSNDQVQLEDQLTRWRVIRDLEDETADACPTCMRGITPEILTSMKEASDLSDPDQLAQAEARLSALRQRGAALGAVLAGDQSDLLKIRWEALDEIAVDIASKKGDLAEIKKQLESVDEEALRRDRADFEKTVREIDAKERALEECNKRLDENSTNISNVQKHLDKLAGADLEGERARRKMYSDVHQLLDEAVAAYREKLRGRVEEDASRHFTALSTEPDYAGLRINTNYGLTIVHQDGQEIPVRSAGAEHVVALSLVGALQNNAPLQGPIIVDSPFGRLDRGHTVNILKALPTMASQTMLLVYEDELPPELARQELKGKLRAEWELDRLSARHTELVPRKD